MTRLTLHLEDEPRAALSSITEPDAIAKALAEIGVGYQRWRADAVLPAKADDAAVLAAYARDIERLKRAGGYLSVDVIRITPDHPARTELRAKFLAEHTHADDEVRFFVEGGACFYLHKAGKVFMFESEAGDLVSVPANTPHWFDMGERPFFTAIRLFVSPEGWVARFTGSAIAEAFPKYEMAA